MSSDRLFPTSFQASFPRIQIPVFQLPDFSDIFRPSAAEGDRPSFFDGFPQLTDFIPDINPSEFPGVDTPNMADYPDNHNETTVQFKVIDGVTYEIKRTIIKKNGASSVSTVILPVIPEGGEEVPELVPEFVPEVPVEDPEFPEVLPEEVTPTEIDEPQPSFGIIPEVAPEANLIPSSADSSNIPVVDDGLEDFSVVSP